MKITITGLDDNKTNIVELEDVGRCYPDDGVIYFNGSPHWLKSASPVIEAPDYRIENIARIPITETFITKKQALSMLVDGDRIHTFRDGVILIGANWSRANILEAIIKYQFQLSGPQATSAGHGMAFRDEYGIVFVETKPLNKIADAGENPPK